MRDDTSSRLSTTLKTAPYYVEEDEITLRTPFHNIEFARTQALASLRTHRRVVIWRQWPHGPRGRETLADYRNVSLAAASR